MARISHITRTILAGVSASALLIATPLVVSSIAPAAAQTRDSISIEFRTGLTPYGSWRTVARWGEVWVPARIARDWQPYTLGNWVYSEDYGWDWISDSSEAEWGWITYHYGRWAFDDTSGWVWVPDNVWGPAWVDWRRGDEHVGWSPLPPDEVVVEYRDNPRFWIFVRTPEMIAPRHRMAFLSLDQRQSILPRTVAVNRTLFLSDRRFAVNPGIAPGIIGAAARQSVRTVEVRPHVVAGTTNIRGAIEVRNDDLRRGGNRPGQSIARATVVQKTVTTVEPMKTVPAPQALGIGEGGKLGDRPPRAAVAAPDRGAADAIGVAPTNQRTAPAIQREDGPAPRKDAAPAERAAPPVNRRQESIAPRQQREGMTPAERTAPVIQREDGTAPPKQQRKDAVPADRGSQTPGTSGQAPVHEERARGAEQHREQAPKPQAQPAASPKAPAPPPSFTLPHKDEKPDEDNRKRN